MRGATEAIGQNARLLLFQSTRPMRGATCTAICCTATRTHFNPRAPCGARQYPQKCGCTAQLFQSTRPMRGATASASKPAIPVSFQSTRPMRGATWIPQPRRKAGLYFNPRAPCGARRSKTRRNSGSKYFNPRAPCGARRTPPCASGEMCPFQSTRPMRGATAGLEVRHMLI